MSEATQIDPKSAVEAGLAQLELSRNFMLPFLEATSDEDYFATPIEQFHNINYIVGHIVYAELHFTQLSGGPEANWPEGTKAFDFGLEFDPSYRPISREEVMAKLTESRERLVKHFRTLTDEQLLAPLPDEYEKFAPNVLSILGLLSWHESMHTGQITAIRRALGHKPLFG